MLHFWNRYQLLNILEKKMTLIAYIFWKLQTANNLVGPMSKTRRFRTPFDRENVKGTQTFVKSAWQRLYHIFSSLWEKPTWKMSLFVICQILGHFVNTLTADDKYSFCNCEILQQLIQMQLPKKQMTFSEFSAPFLKSTSFF